MAQSNPLQWPDHIPRSSAREKSRFRTNYDTALQNVIKSLRAFGNESGKPVNGATLSSNMDLLQRQPADPGVAVWFVWDNTSICIPVDRYTSPAENLQAIHHIIEARRTELRHGTLHLVRATFQGFKALPPPPGSPPKRPWWQVLGMTAPTTSRDTIMARYKEAAQKMHPDVDTGSHDAMAELNRARDEALKSL